MYVRLRNEDGSQSDEWVIWDGDADEFVYMVPRDGVMVRRDDDT